MEMFYKSMTPGGPKKEKLSLKASLMWSNSHLNDLTRIIVIPEHQCRAKLGFGVPTMRIVIFTCVWIAF